MKYVVASLAFLGMLHAMSASAQTAATEDRGHVGSGPKYVAPGAPKVLSAQQKCAADWDTCSSSERLQVAKAICGPDWKGKWEAEDLAAYGYNKLSRHEFRTRISADCTLTDPTKTATAVVKGSKAAPAPEVDDEDDGDQPDSENADNQRKTRVAGVYGREGGAPTFAQIRQYLGSYRGPMMQPNGQMLARHRNKIPPADARPCRVPGIPYTVMCRQVQ